MIVFATFVMVIVAILWGTTYFNATTRHNRVLVSENKALRVRLREIEKTVRDCRDTDSLLADVVLDVIDKQRELE